jgi:hypothetical protein
MVTVAELELAIGLFVAHHNIDPKPCIWTARASDLLAKVTLAKERSLPPPNKYRTECALHSR